MLPCLTPPLLGETLEESYNRLPTTSPPSTTSSIPLITDPFASTKGTHWNTGPLIYAHTTWATHSDVGDNTVAGDELYIYNPSTSVAAGVETFIAYNARSACWRDWHLGNDPDHVSQFASTNTVTCWVAGQRYFQFISPFPLTVTTLEPTTTNQTPVTAFTVVTPISFNTPYGAWGDSHLIHNVSASTPTLVVYDSSNIGAVVPDLQIGYNITTSQWVDVGADVPDILVDNNDGTISFFAGTQRYFTITDPY